MKCLIVGCSARQYTDKKTHEQRLSLNLFLVKNSVKAYGKMCEEIFVTDNDPLYESIISVVEGVASDLVGYFVNVDRDSRGYLEGFELLDKCPDAVIWDF